MNIFSFLGDLVHVASILILINTIEKNKSWEGISLKTQALLTLGFIARYLNVFQYISVYNTLMKIIYVSSSIYTVYLMTHKYKKEIRENSDTFPVKYLVAGSFVLGLIFNYKFSFIEIFWSFSLWLEAVAIIPQFYLLQKTGETKGVTADYIFALGLYRCLYIPNWIYRYFTEKRMEYISVLAGVLELAVYSDFFYVYYTKIFKGKGINLPV